MMVDASTYPPEIKSLKQSVDIVVMQREGIGFDEAVEVVRGFVKQE